eukprot:CCRYP_009169-RA/>CCRYP_009169-RA protein AED:0.12 eAED:0.12 QI:0/0.16/0/1/1/1/7/0/820
MLLHLWNHNDDFLGIVGFSQGSRLAHILSILHHITHGKAFHGLEFVIHPTSYIHPGGHYVPVKAVDVAQYLPFLRHVDEQQRIPPPSTARTNLTTLDETHTHLIQQPDEEHAQIQIEEVVALSLIFPINRIYQHPLQYSILLQPQHDGNPDEEEEERLWPPKPISLGIQYPPNYPDVSPTIRLIHDMNYHEFSMQQSEALMTVLRRAMEEEGGMPCVMGMVYAAREFFEGGGWIVANTTTTTTTTMGCWSERECLAVPVDDRVEGVEGMAVNTTGSTGLRPCSVKRIAECNEQGLEIAYGMLGRTHSDDVGLVNGEKTTNETSVGKGGSWKYTIGLVGKPSAGKSTFFNAATAFARQRGGGGGAGGGAGVNRDGNSDSDTILDGAAMAPHPFTTIDPNVGFCLVPAPAGSCPEDDEGSMDVLVNNRLVLGSTHGRDSKGRRMISLCLKDVAGLVPGAYQGRGKGNKFLDDLTDADVLVHVVDASGLSDAEGNKVASDERTSETNHPINDLAWVRNELVEWVFFNIASKWDNVVRRGRDKLVGMFSGYKQSQSFVLDVFAAVENYIKEKEGRDRIFDNLKLWDEGDLHRLVSAFLGMRFPMALALNKCDLPTSKQYINDIQAQLPIHGAHVGIGLSAHEEMKFMRHYIGITKKECTNRTIDNCSIPNGVWDCLQAAMSIRAPVLVFPVNDMLTYEPLPGMTNYSTRDASLPNRGMISCLTHAGGCAPSHWDADKQIYAPSITKTETKPALRDVLLLKPGSTVNDVFEGLKWIGALQGEFVRAEGASSIGDKPKLVSKWDVVGKQNRILRIMTTKRRTWQNK